VPSLAFLPLPLRDFLSPSLPPSLSPSLPHLLPPPETTKQIASPLRAAHPLLLLLLLLLLAAAKENGLLRFLLLWWKRLRLLLDTRKRKAKGFGGGLGRCEGGEEGGREERKE